MTHQLNGHQTLRTSATSRSSVLAWRPRVIHDAAPVNLLTGMSFSPEFDLHAAVAPDGTLWVAVSGMGLIRVFQYSPTSGAVTNDSPLMAGVGADRHPFVLVTSDGTPHVFWHGDPSAMAGLQMARFTAGAWSSPTQLTIDAGDFPTAGQVADGGIWVVWQTGLGPPHDLLAQRLDPASPWLGVPRRLTVSPSDDANPHVVVERGSSLWLFWASDRNAVGGSPDVDLFYKRLVTSV